MRRAAKAALAAAAMVGVVCAAASWDRCGEWARAEPARVSQAEGRGALLAGAARVELKPPFPVTVAGYRLSWHTVESSQLPLFTRALVIQVGETKWGVATADVLLIPPDVAREVQSRAATLGLKGMWVAATHTHSSWGGYDARKAAQWGGMGTFRAEARAALVEGLTAALEKANAALRPAALKTAEGEVARLVKSRDEGNEADGKLTRLSFQPLSGHGAPIADVVIFSVHPTLMGRKPAQLSPDYPGYFSAGRETSNNVVLLLMGAVGNASAPNPLHEFGEPAFVLAKALSDAVEALPLKPVAKPSLFASETQFSVPRPDASRLLPGPFQAAAENVLCESTEKQARLGFLRLGPVSLLAVPGEVTKGAAETLREATGASRVISLVNGYFGYLEKGEWVEEGRGESHRQYFDSALLQRVREASIASAR